MLAKYNPDISISVLSIDPLEYQAPSWQEFENVLKRAMEGHPLMSKQKDIIDALRKEVLQPNKKYAGTEAANTIDIFRGIIQETKKSVTVIVHCEALLVALAIAALNHQFDLGDPQLNAVCKVVHYACIDVLKGLMDFTIGVA